MHTQNKFRIFIFCLAGLMLFPSILFANNFNQIFLKKQLLEKEFGIKTLECFPFIKKIGFTEDQIPLLKKCLHGISSLQEALSHIQHNDYKEIGISNRFLRTAGFQTVLVNWEASPQEIENFLNGQLQQHEQNEFMKQIRALKNKIGNQGLAKEIYCSKEISNNDCLEGYKNLSEVLNPKRRKRTGWHEIMITHSSFSADKPYKLILGFNEASTNIKNKLAKDPYETWNPKRKMYETIQEKYGKAFKDKLQLENFICSAELNLEECQQGAENLMAASQSTDFRMRYWGKVIINRYNTLIEDDFHAQIRFDLPPKKIIQHFSKKAIKTKAAENTTLAVKLESRTKNNSTKLRAVCDLEGLRSELCAQAFKTFIRFVKNHRDYQVKYPWNTIMFIDGDQLSRVNFALNSNSRKTYIYIDANSTDEELLNFLATFQSKN